MRYFILFMASLALLGCNSKTVETEGFTIDPGIQQEVESVVREMENDLRFGPMMVYETNLQSEVYLNDNLKSSNMDSPGRYPYKSFYYVSNDTLKIDGGYGLFGSFGTSIHLIDNKAEVYLLLAADDFPQYASTQDGPLQLRLEVPTKESSLVLSNIPEPEEGGVVYGKVSFESEEFYQGVQAAEGEQAEPRKKGRMNMIIYFKSGFVDLEKGF